MKVVIPFALIMMMLTSCFTAREPGTQAGEPVRVIFDTDMGPDYDDVGAIAVLHALADSGKAEILATMASTKHDNVAAVLNVLNTYFRRPDIPIGVPGGEGLRVRDFQGWSDTLVVKYPHAIKSNSDAQDATSLYREILSKQPDESVTIITVGFLTNIAALMRSPPDEYSDLSGHDLMKKKVKRLVSMAGQFPEGAEYNVRKDSVAGLYVFNNVEVPVLLSGFEIGVKIKTGFPLIRNAAIRNSPVKDVYRISIPKSPGDSTGRSSWDQTAVLVGVVGPEPYYKIHTGRMVVASDGSNRWIPEGSAHSHLVENMPAEDVRKVIDRLMMHRP